MPMPNLGLGGDAQRLQQILSAFRARGMSDQEIYQVLQQVGVGIGQKPPTNPPGSASGLPPQMPAGAQPPPSGPGTQPPQTMPPGASAPPAGPGGGAPPMLPPTAQPPPSGPGGGAVPMLPPSAAPPGGMGAGGPGNPLLARASQVPIPREKPGQGVAGKPPIPRDKPSLADRAADLEKYKRMGYWTPQTVDLLHRRGLL